MSISVESGAIKNTARKPGVSSLPFSNPGHLSQLGFRREHLFQIAGFLRRHCFRGRDTGGLPREVLVSAIVAKRRALRAWFSREAVLHRQELRIVSAGSLQQCFPIKLFHKRTLFQCNTSGPYHPSMIESVFPCGHDSPGQQCYTGQERRIVTARSSQHCFRVKTLS
jgi:hypothetical protein